MSLALLEHLLTARLSLLLASRHAYPANQRISSAVVPTDRLILLRQGAITYEMEGRSQSLPTGAMWLVPAWTKRSWQAAAQGCELAWVEFVVHPTPAQPMPSACRTQPDAELASSLLRVIGLAKREDSQSSLLAEMGLKDLLARLLADGGSSQRAADGQGLSAIMAMMREHLHEPDALHRVYAQAGMPVHRLRAKFRAAVGVGPAEYLHRLRMQQARYLLLSSALSVKEIAGRVGFDDPLYFSRRYRQHWRKPPMEDRAPNP